MRIHKAIVIQASDAPIRDLFDLAFRTRKQARQALGHDQFKVLPIAYFDATTKCHITLIEYDIDNPRTHRGAGLDAAMRALTKAPVTSLSS